MRRRLGLYLLALSLALLFLAAGTPAGRSQGNDNSGKSQDNDNSEPTFATIDFPGATATLAVDITPNADSLVGEFTDAAGRHGFLLKSGAFTSIDVPGSVRTDAHGINARGEIVGLFETRHGQSHGFLMNRDGFTSFDAENATSTGATGINDRGDIVGGWCDGTITPCPLGDEGNRGFLLSDGQFTSIDFPGASLTLAWKINSRGDITGTYIDASGIIHGFLWSAGAFSSMDFPGAAGTEAFGINDQGDIVGRYCPAPPCRPAQIIGWHGFLLTHGEFAAFDFPGAQFTWPLAINRRGDIAGAYRDSSNKNHGFLISKGEDEDKN